jgi:pantetheine-phosphate adenylyltransferase
MRRAIYPGSFDPITNGHMDIIERSCRLFDEVIIGLLINSHKTSLFTLAERQSILDEVLNSVGSKVKIKTFGGLLVDFATQEKACAVVRGLRAVADYEYELNMANMNRRLAPQIETVFLMASGSYSYVSSKLVKEVFQLGGDITGLVPSLVESRMKEKLQA